MTPSPIFILADFFLKFTVAFTFGREFSAFWTLDEQFLHFIPSIRISFLPVIFAIGFASTITEHSPPPPQHPALPCILLTTNRIAKKAITTTIAIKITFIILTFQKKLPAKNGQPFKI